MAKIRAREPDVQADVSLRAKRYGERRTYTVFRTAAFVEFAWKVGPISP